MESTAVDTVVLGAGLAGCSLAHHLSRRHGGSIAVVDRGTPASGATGRSGGVITEQLWNAWDVEMVRQSHLEYAEMCQRERPAAYRRNGFLRWTHRPEVATVLRASRERLKDWGVATDLLDADGLAERLPEARFEPGAIGLYSAGDATVDPTALTGLYEDAGRRRGVRFDLGTTVGEPVWEEGRWTVESGSGRLRASRLVLAAGAWSKAISARLGRPLPLAPYRTQAALLRPGQPAREQAPTGHDLDTDVYVRPESNGRVLAGDGTELVEVDPDRVAPGGDAEFLAHLAEVLGARWPRWGDASVAAAWSGVCASTPDRRPLVGEVDPERSLYAMCGFNGFGVMRAGAIARRLADLLDGGSEGDRAAGALRPVAPGRFRGPPRPFPPRPGFTLEGGDDPRF